MEKKKEEGIKKTEERREKKEERGRKREGRRGKKQEERRRTNYFWLMSYRFNVPLTNKKHKKVRCAHR